MLRCCFSKLQQHLQRSAMTTGKRYGILACVEVVDVQNDGDSARREANENVEKYEKYLIHNTETPHRLHLNVEDLNTELQAVFAERYIETLKNIVEANKIERISFNFVNEDVFRCKLNMAIRRLGFTSSFQRYNDDRGLAEFKVKCKKLEDVDLKRVGAYFRRAYTKSRKTDLQTLVM